MKKSEFRKCLFEALRMLFISLILVTLLFGCSETEQEPNESNKSSTDWAFSFVVWDGYIYELNDEYVEDLNEEIGEVTSNSDLEGNYSGNFSNKYEKGTKYFSIVGVKPEEAIAIKEVDGKYRKAIRNGKYGEK